MLNKPLVPAHGGPHALAAEKMPDETRNILAAALRGTLDIEHTDRGIIPLRLPKWTQEQHDAEFLNLSAAQTSGVRVAFRTRATQVALTVHSTRLLFPDIDPETVPVPYAATSEDGREELVSETQGSCLVLSLTDKPALHPGEDATLQLQLGGAGVERKVEIWLPNNAAVEILDISADAPLHPITEVTSPRWIHYGSSISQCAEADSPLGVWPVAAARAMGMELTSMGFGGSAHLDQFVARTIRDHDPELISLKIGINVVNGDTLKRRTFLPAVHGFLDTIREAHPDVPILLISPIICPMHETTPGPVYWDVESKQMRPAPASPIDQDFGSLDLVGVRRILEDVVRSRSGRDSALFYVDGLDLLGWADADELPDGVHPSSRGYLRMAERFVQHEAVTRWFGRP